ncbi:unnamed protein product [Withania somnifera]
MEDNITAANGSSHHSVDTKSNKQKMKKVDWTPELHKLFVEAVDQLGVEQALHADVWGYPVVPPLWSWSTYPRELQADVWGYPVGPSSLGSCPTYPQGEEMIGNVVNEVMSNPWLPLPLGLKLPSIDIILPELP